MSKGERNRVKVRARTAMASQTQIEGRFRRHADLIRKAFILGLQLAVWVALGFR